MKRVRLLLVILLACVLAFSVPLFAQEDTLDAEEDTTTAVEDTGKDSGKGTMTFKMGEIVVSDKAVANIEASSTTTEITEEEIQSRSDKTLADSLQMVPGVVVEQTAKGMSGFNMRGFSQERVAILIDGVPVLDPYEGGSNIDLSMIPVTNVSRIVVNRGSASALYGALGSIGSINIITKKPERLTAAANIEYGEHKNYTISAEAGAPIGDFYAWITATRMYSEGYEISDKLDKDKRRDWFEKLSSYEHFTTYGAIDLDALDNYLNDTGVWNNTSYTKHQLSGRVGYEITRDMEAGVSASYSHNEAESNTFKDNSVAYFEEGSPGSWSTPTTWNSDMKRAGFTNRAFYWPEDWRLSVSPYFMGEFDDLKVRLNTFYVKQRNVLEGYFNQDRDGAWMFPSSAADHTSGPEKMSQSQSIYEESSAGFYLLPEYRFNSWNTLAMSIHYRFEHHEKLDKVLDSSSALASVIGTDETTVLEMQANYITVAAEDQMNFDTRAGNLSLSAGISYDAQDYAKIKSFNTTTDELEANPLIDDDATIWGTRDSFNPVLSAMLDPIEDLLRLRTALAMKTNFPNMSIYKDLSTGTQGEAIEPERIYSFNAGFELFFLDKAISFRNDYFYTNIKDKISSLVDPATGDDYYTNIDGITAQGLESTLQTKFSDIANIMDVTAAVSYVFTHARNDEADPYTYDVYVEEMPMHQFIWQFVLDFVTDTSCTIWGTHSRNQVKYVMNSDPSVTSTNEYTSDVYDTVKLHNPFMLHLKVQQTFLKNYSVYVTCKNVLDDYNANPFNPGPGRMFYFGANAKL